MQLKRCPARSGKVVYKGLAREAVDDADGKNWPGAVSERVMYKDSRE